MKAVATKIVAIALLSLAAVGSAQANSPSLSALDFDYAYLNSNSLYLYSAFAGSSGAFTDALQATWQQYGSAPAFESAIDAVYAQYYPNAQPLGVGWASNDTVVFQDPPSLTSWSVTFNASTANYTTSGSSTPVSLNAPDPVAGSGLFALIAAAGLAAFAMHKRGETFG